MTWNEQFKAARKLRKLTQTEVAVAADISLRAYQKIEAGDVWPQYDTILKICTLLGIKSLKILQ